MNGSSDEKELKEGIRDSIPIILGYLPIGLAFGVLASQGILDSKDTILMSVLVFAGASQFVAIELIDKGLTTLSIVVTTFLVNSRHILMSASLSPFFREIGNKSSAILAFGITDETFALNSIELKKREKRTKRYIAGVHLSSYLSWVLSTVLGVFLGGYISNPSSFGLDFALTAMFIALLVIHLTDYSEVIIAIFAILLSISLLPFFGNEATLIIATLVSSLVGVALR